MKKSILKKALCVALGVTLICCMPMEQVCAKGGQHKMPSGKHHVKEYNDCVPNQPTEPKVMLNEFKQMDNATGRLDFWNSIDPEDLNEYYISEDLTVEFKNPKAKSASDIAKKDAFEESLNQYVSKVEEYCSNKDMGLNETITDGKGGLNVGSLSGNGNGTNALSVSSLVRGDIILLNDGGTQIYGAIMHAGMYDGSSSDWCIYSASPNASSTNQSTGVRWERLSDYRKNDQAWTMNVKGTTKAQRAAAFDYVRKYATWGETYDWSASKTSTNKWYCSKIPYYAYKNSGVKIDIDYDGGYWCYPVDIYNDNNTNLIKYYP